MKARRVITKTVETTREKMWTTTNLENTRVITKTKRWNQ